MKAYPGEKGRKLQGKSVLSMRAIAEVATEQDSLFERELGNLLLDVLDAYNDEETEKALGDMYFHLCPEMEIL